MSLLREAMTAHLDAMDVYVALGSVEDQVTTTINLGNAQATLALSLESAKEEVAERSQLLERAIEGYRGAKAVITKDARPAHWALLHTNMGGVFVLQESYPQAIEAYEDALTVYTPQDYPVAWVQTKRHLSAAMVTYSLSLGMNTEAHEYLRKAKQGLEEGLVVAEPETREWALLHRELGRAFGGIGILAGLTGGAEAALVDFRAALEHFDLALEVLNDSMPEEYRGTVTLRTELLAALTITCAASDGCQEDAEVAAEEQR